MELIQKLSQNELDMMGWYIDNYAFEHGGSRHTTVENILRVWDQDKRDLCNMLGGQLILEKKVDFEVDENELADIIYNKMFEDDDFCFIRQFNDKFCYNYDLSWETKRNYSDLFSCTSLASNRYDGDTFEVIVPGGKSFKVQHGAKTMKMLAKIAEAFGLDGFEDFRLAHSMILNQKKFSGTMCLSIHPMDFMTMSDNGANWSSCMSWMDTGCYRRGTVEMMNSDIVIVAYLKSDENMELSRSRGYEWNSKKWRQLFIVTDDIISNVKAYPYRNDNLTDICLDWLKDLKGADKYLDKITSYDHDTMMTLGENTRFGICFETNTMYNDFNDDQRAYINKHYAEYGSGDLFYNYSGADVCMGCGGIEAYYDYEGSLACQDCEPTYSCYHCGDSHDQDEMYELDGEYFCQYCYEDHVAVCDLTDEEHYDQNMNEVAIAVEVTTALGDTKIVKTNWTKQVYCGYLRDIVDDGYAKEITEIQRQRTGWSWRNGCQVIMLDDLTEKGSAWFGLDDEDEFAAFTDELKSYQQKVITNNMDVWERC